MKFNDAFRAELAAIDSVLGHGVDGRIEELELEIAALEPRILAAQARMLIELTSKLEGMVSERRKHHQALLKYRAFAGLPKPIPVVLSTPSFASIESTVRVRAKSTDVAVIEPAAPPIPEPDFMAQIVDAAPIKPKVPRGPLVKAIQAFSKRERAFLAEPGWSNGREADLKSMVCELRGLISQANEAQLDDDHLWESLRIFREEFNANTQDSSFFGFNPSREHTPKVWQQLADAFKLLAPAMSALDWIEKNPEAVNEGTELLKLAAATEAWIHRLAVEHDLGFTEDQQREIHRRVESLASDIYIPWWNQGDGRIATEQVAEAAQSLPKIFEETARRYESARNKDRSLIALQELASSLEADGPIEETLVPAVRQCLEAGIPPSNKVLVAVCLPYRSVLKEVDERQFARLNEYLQKEETRLAIRNLVPGDPDEDASEEQDSAFEEVKQYLTGKTILFIGGRRIPEKKRQVEEAFGLKELVWPDADPDTLLHDFTSSAMKADVVCYLIRWSRHSYKQVIDFAKGQGKETVTIKAGLGINRLAHDFYDQLITHDGTS